ncbi:MAG: hypothetical protein IPH49_02265 [Ignavibacteria bacterium]|nr:hypothetical protein [Ignavibacteria bacterium]
MNGNIFRSQRVFSIGSTLSISMRPLLLLLSLVILTDSISAQFLAGNLPFGKNKKQYEKFNWRYIQSENFDVYFHGDAEYIAKYTALKAEDALKQIQEELSFSITKRIVLIIYSSHNQFQQTNVIDEFMSEGIGGVTELFKNRVVLPFEGDYAKFRHVIHHELVHAVINDMFYGGSIQALMSSSGAAMLPLWMNEGFAEYSSANGLDEKTDMFMRDVAVVNTSVVSVSSTATSPTVEVKHSGPISPANMEKGRWAKSSTGSAPLATSIERSALHSA